ncbi:mitochondrial carrier [Aspergillus homomorphus CBS 101889]|uniref:Mitochondrial carrier n=1 Tax=Aspergillus homomorphus (strain CBS 101889) TaxID=1450537 RepID=A0A395HYM8_ASPHC|nr:mitochondrial carrier [Aspergillus homomorphus CBS 101889]RAL12619.1 mitochondrial carrier [Aspergillus homomorphus CBS 101889]
MTPRKQVSPWQSIVAGGAAGGFASLLTPTAAKHKDQPRLTSSQHHSTTWHRHLYTGSMAFCVSNASKSEIRFFAFDTARKYMPTDAKGKVSSIGNLFVGMMAGVAGSLAVATPGETLSAKIIDDRAGAKQYRSATHATRRITASESISGLYRGVVPVTMKQSANAMTRLQAIVSLERYKGTMDCVQSVIRNEGIASLWRGSTPRLARLSISGAVSFTVYAKVIEQTIM